MKFSTILVFVSASSALAQQYSSVASASITDVQYAPPTTPCPEATTTVDASVETPVATPTGTPPCDEPTGAVNPASETQGGYQPTQAAGYSKNPSYAAQMGSGAGSQFAAPSLMVMIGLFVAGMVY